MNEEQGPKSGGRFLSKVVKFVTSPTTDWADLNKVGGPLDASESSAALKEMIERKRRNDFVRNREFDMLRKARRRQLAGAHGGAVSPTSFISSVESAHPHEPERTLEKIDRIEEQMSRAWLDRDEPAATAENPRAYDKTRPVQLGERTAGTIGFGATAVEVPLSGAAAEVSRGEAAPHAPAAADPWADPAPSPSLADESEPVVVGPEVEEVAIRFANGDAAGAEVSLLELLGEGGSHSNDLETWLTLFDLYRAAGEPDKFDGAAIAFVSRFGRSAPQFELVASPGSAAMPITPQAGAAATPRDEAQPVRMLEHADSHFGLAAELARQRPFGAGAVRQDAAEHFRARSDARDLLDFGLAIDREEPDAERIGARDVALLLDRVAEGDAVRRGTGGKRHLDLRHVLVLQHSVRPGVVRQLAEAQVLAAAGLHRSLA